MKLISWNVNARVKAVPEQVKALSYQEPHIVALQDVRITAIAEYKQAFARIGLCHIIHTFQETSEKVPTGVLIASCFEMSQLPNLPPSILWSKGLLASDSKKIDRHWTKRTLFVTVQSPLGEIDLYNVYITPGVHQEKMSEGLAPYGRIKLDLLTGIYHALSMPQERLRILCGDFNTPQEEKQTGEIITWGYNKQRSRMYPLLGTEQDTIERAILQGLTAYDLSDVYRRFHGYNNCGSEEAQSWRKYRYDHIFASQALHPQNISYLQNFRNLRLSDHIPIEVMFDLKV
jgi:exonuclease III